MESTKMTGKRQARFLGMSQAWAFAFLAFAVGISLTAMISLFERGREARARLSAFETEAHDVKLAVRSELESSEMLLRSIQALYYASTEVSEQEFKAAFDGLHTMQNLPSLKALSLAKRQMHADGNHYVVDTVQPAVISNKLLKGLDINTQPESLRTLQLSRDLDEVVMSAPFRLRQADATTSEASGVVMRMPIFSSGAVPSSVSERRSRMHASLAASFMIEDLVKDALWGSMGDQMSVRLFDVTDGARTVIYRNQWKAPPDAPTINKEISFGQRTWRLILSDLKTPPAWPAWLQVLLMGASTSVLFGALVWSLSSTHGRAVALADSMSARLDNLNELLPTLVILFDLESGKISYANQAARRRMGIPEGGILLDEVMPESVIERFSHAVAGHSVSFQEKLRAPDGEDFWASIVARKIELDGVSSWLLVASDISEQRQLTERLSYQASHDALTGLPNRHEFEARLRNALATQHDKRMALLFVDLDQFKFINDSSGHIAGDQLLVQLALLMADQLHPDDVLARLGGDEFAVLLHNVADREHALRMAERLRLAIDGYAFIWDGRSHICSVSIGGTLIEGENESLKELFAQVDAACYTSKDAGRNRVHFYSGDNSAPAQRRGEMGWVNRIQAAMEQSRMVLAYQEFMSFSAESCMGLGVEVLLRIRDEQGGLVMPGAFLPAAERYGLMPRIDRWVIDTTLANLDNLHPLGKALDWCSINLSAETLEEEDFTEYVLGSFARHNADPKRVMFEITETTAVRDLGRVSRLVAELRATGCRVALDDFGAGMSSFGYLKTLGIDTIKIDGSFVTDIENDAVSYSIVRAITEIGHEHGLQVIAEWVSGEQQIGVLKKIGVDHGQGFGIHAPELAVFHR